MFNFLDSCDDCRLAGFRVWICLDCGVSVYASSAHSDSGRKKIQINFWIIILDLHHFQIHFCTMFW
jgi:hypothetical protein